VAFVPFGVGKVHKKLHVQGQAPNGNSWLAWSKGGQNAQDPVNSPTRKQTAIQQSSSPVEGDASPAEPRPSTSRTESSPPPVIYDANNLSKDTNGLQNRNVVTSLDSNLPSQRYLQRIKSPSLKTEPAQKVESKVALNTGSVDSKESANSSTQLMDVPTDVPAVVKSTSAVPESVKKAEPKQSGTESSDSNGTAKPSRRAVSAPADIAPVARSKKGCR